MTIDPQPYPSIADFRWLASAAAMLIALARLATASFTGVSLAVLLDGVVGPRVASLGLALFYETLEDLTAPGLPDDVLATNLA